MDTGSRVNRLAVSRQQRRQFTSRHVPEVAEVVAASVENFSDSSQCQQNEQRFNGLLSHLKQSSTLTSDQRWKSAVAEGPIAIPTEFEEALRAKFESLCSRGERTNLELLPAARWATLLQNSKVISDTKRPKSKKAPASTCISMAQADVSFHKVIRHHNRSDRRLTYDLFCEALLLVAFCLYPDVEDEVALRSLLVRIVEESPKDSVRVSKTNGGELAMEDSIQLELNSFRRHLKDVFLAFTARCLQGKGNFPRRRDSQLSSPSPRASSRIPRRASESSLDDSPCSTYVGEVASSATTCASISKSSCSDDSVIMSRATNARMSLDQLLLLCREFKLVPHLASPIEVTCIFIDLQRKSQPCQGSGRQSSLCFEDFIEAMGRLALKAYSKSPFSEEYPTPQAKIKAFLQRCFNDAPRKPSERLLNRKS